MARTFSAKHTKYLGQAHKLKKNSQAPKTKLKCNISSKFKSYISNEYRKGNIHHCYADITKAQKLLNFKPTITLQNGLTELAEWAKTHDWGAIDLFKKALKELKERRLTA